MDLFTHLFAVLGIAIRLPEIEAEAKMVLFRNGITVLRRMEFYADQGGVPAVEVREKIAQMRDNLMQWRKKEFAYGEPEQRFLIATSVALAGEEDVSEL